MEKQGVTLKIKEAADGKPKKPDAKENTMDELAKLVKETKKNALRR